MEITMSFNRLRIPLLTGIYFLLTTFSIAQIKQIQLSLEEALRSAKENNAEIKLADAEVNAAKADFNKSLAALLPQITLSETFVRTNDPLNSFGLKLKQEIVTALDFNPALLNDPGEINNFNTKIEVKQPLINLDGFFGRAAAADGLAARKFKKQRTESYMEFMTKMTYHQMNLLHKSYNVVEEALKTAKANRKLIKDYYDEGLITKADYLMAEVFVSNLESQFSEVSAQLNNTSDNLKQMIGLDEMGLIVPTDSLEYNPLNKELKPETDALTSRSDILAYTNKLSAMENAKTMNWMKMLPRLNAFGSFEYNDSELFGTGADNWMIGVNLQWNIFNGFQNIADIQKSSAEYNSAKIEYEKALITGRNEIEASLRDLETAEKKLKVAETSVSQSLESLKIIKDRYTQGLEKTTDLLNAETTASGAKLDYIKALFFYNVSVYKVELMLEQKVLENN
jgi:outer membrane protein TolC